MIGSLWKVDDVVTRDLMERFYTNLWEKELGKLEALREAALGPASSTARAGLEAEGAATDSKRYRRAIRAAFVLSGDWRVIAAPARLAALLSPAMPGPIGIRPAGESGYTSRPCRRIDGPIHTQAASFSSGKEASPMDQATNNQPTPATSACAKTASEKGIVPFCSADSAKSGQSPSVFAPGRQLIVYRAAVGAMLLAVILGAWFTVHKQAADRQAQAVAAIRMLGGECYYDCPDPHTQAQPGVDCGELSPVPACLLEWLGFDFFHSVREVNLIIDEPFEPGVEPRERFVAADPEWLLAFPDLRVLVLPGSDESLAYVGRLTNLVDLRIFGPELTDAGVAHLAGLRQLEFLRLEDTAISDESLAVLARLPRLTSLMLQGNCLTDRGLAYLGSMRQLTELWLGGTGMESGRGLGITDAGVPHLAHLANLEQLISRIPRSRSKVWPPCAGWNSSSCCRSTWCMTIRMRASSRGTSRGFTRCFRTAKR